MEAFEVEFGKEQRLAGSEQRHLDLPAFMAIRPRYCWLDGLTHRFEVRSGGDVEALRKPRS
jgi:hypothetical protein